MGGVGAGKRNEGMMMMMMMMGGRKRRRREKDEKKMQETRTGGTPMRKLPASS